MKEKISQQHFHFPKIVGIGTLPNPPGDNLKSKCEVQNYQIRWVDMPRPNMNSSYGNIFGCVGLLVGLIL